MTTFLPRTQPTSLGDLLTRTGSGDERAFEALHDRGAATVHGLVLRALRDPAVSEEVTWTVWVRVWRSADRYTPDQGSALGWVMALAHRTVVERIRSAQREPGPDRVGYERTEPLGVEPDRTETPGAEADPNAHLSVAARRRAVLLAYYQGCTCEQISRTLGVPHETVVTTVHSGLMHLRGHLRMADNTALDADRW